MDYTAQARPGVQAYMFPLFHAVSWKLQSLLSFFRAPQRTLRLWNAREASLRTSPFLHDFERETWALGLRLGPNGFQHHLAVMELLRDVIEPTPS